MKFKTGDKVRKIKGYKFEGIVIGGAYKLDGERILYMVEVEKEIEVEIYDDGGNDTICDMIEQNCGGMVHIFAESDIELIN